GLQSPPAREIRAIHEDADGNLWVGTRGRGLSVYHEGRWYNPNSFSEPFNDLVCAIVADAQDRLWIGSPQGVLGADRKSLLEAAVSGSQVSPFRAVATVDQVTGAGI